MHLYNSKIYLEEFSFDKIISWNIKRTPCIKYLESKINYPIYKWEIELKMRSSLSIFYGNLREDKFMDAELKII